MYQFMVCTCFCILRGIFLLSACHDLKVRVKMETNVASHCLAWWEAMLESYAQSVLLVTTTKLPPLTKLTIISPEHTHVKVPMRLGRLTLSFTEPLVSPQGCENAHWRFCKSSCNGKLMRKIPGGAPSKVTQATTQQATGLKRGRLTSCEHW